MENNLLQVRYKILCFGIIGLFTSCISLLISIQLKIDYYGLIIGFILMLSTIPIHLLGKRNSKLYYLCYILNSIGTGCSISTYYLTRNIIFNNFFLFVASLIIIIFSLILIYLKNHLNFYHLFSIINSFITILLIIIVILWIKNEPNTFYSINFFLLVQMFFYIIFAYTIEDKNISRLLSFYSYGIYFIISIIVLSILTEGDLISDLFIPDIEKKKKAI